MGQSRAMAEGEAEVNIMILNYASGYVFIFNPESAQKKIPTKFTSAKIKRNVSFKLFHIEKPKRTSSVDRSLDTRE